MTSYQIFLKFCVLISVIGLVASTSTNQPPSSYHSINTGEGSYFEYAIRTVIRHIWNHPRCVIDNISRIHQMFFYYHLQMLHIDLTWTRNWLQVFPNQLPSIFDLPSRAVQFFYNYTVDYDFNDGVSRTLDSHQLDCDACKRLFHKNVDQLGNHLLQSGSVGSKIDVAHIQQNEYSLRERVGSSHCNQALERPSTSRTHHQPEKCNLVATGSGSFFEYAVRNAIHNACYYPRYPNQHGISDAELIVYYYHLQMIHIDLLWLNNYIIVCRNNNSRQYPSVFDLPSRNVRYFYDNEPQYNFNTMQPWTLNSHQLNCAECNRMFNDDINLIRGHAIEYVTLRPILFDRITTIPTREIALEQEQRYNCGKLISSTTTTNPRDELRKKRNLYISSKL